MRVTGAIIIIVRIARFVYRHSGCDGGCADTKSSLRRVLLGCGGARGGSSGC